MRYYDEDGDYLVGESLAGPQTMPLMGYEEELIGAAQQLNELRSQVASLARRAPQGAVRPGARRAGPRRPAASIYRPAADVGYSNQSTQIAVLMKGNLVLTSWTAGGPLPRISGTTRVQRSFTPTKAILVETLTVTFSTSALGATTRVAVLKEGDDLLLIEAYSAGDNCFPYAPNEDNAISGPTFANNSLGNGIAWPTLEGGLDLQVGVAIQDSAIYQVTPPTGYTSDNISKIVVNARLNLMGPSVRR